MSKNKNKNKEIKTEEKVEVEIAKPSTDLTANDTCQIIDLEESEKNDKVVFKREGVVVECSLLNVREFARKSSDVIAIISEGCVVALFSEEEDTEDFYKVLTEDGSVGYCMKRFIEIVK